MGDPAVAELPLGEPVDWTPARMPERAPLRGEHVLARPLTAGDAEALHEAAAGDPHLWTYLPYGPFESVEDLRAWLAEAEASEDPLFFAIEVGGAPLGQASFLRMQPEGGSIEVGHIWFAPALRRTAASVEAILLLAEHAFEACGYRRLEWSCNSLNTPSRRAAERFGFTFEGIARKAGVSKGHNRDTAWFSVTDDEWPAVKQRLLEQARVHY
jgi:RimJ/RimL family protein N-acetyltransferase